MVIWVIICIVEGVTTEVEWPFHLVVGLNGEHILYEGCALWNVPLCGNLTNDRRVCLFTSHVIPAATHFVSFAICFCVGIGVRVMGSGLQKTVGFPRRPTRAILLTK